MANRIYTAMMTVTAIAVILTGCGTGHISVGNVNTITGETETYPYADPADYDLPATTEIMIGTTGYSISVPSDYYGADVTEEERRDDMIAYYKSDEHLMDFDVYQFSRDYTSLEEYTTEESKEYGAEDFDIMQINGTLLTRYYSNETYEGKEYKVANYIFETETDFGELSFWLDGDDAEELTEQIISTITKTDYEAYDMLGIVVDRSTDNAYEYNVKGDNDVIYVCNYNGDDELSPGTNVYMYMIQDDGWTIEAADR